MKRLKTLLAASIFCAAGIAQAGEAMLFENPDLADYSFAIRSDVADLGAYGVMTSVGSINIISGSWEFCTEREFRGMCKVYGPGEYRRVNGGYGERVLSAREVRHRAPVAIDNAPPRIELYPEVDFRGAGMNHFRDLDALRWGVRSVIVHGGVWEICTDTNFRGRCQVLQPGQYRALDNQLSGARSIRAFRPPVQTVAAPALPRYQEQRQIDPLAALAGAIIAGAVGGNLNSNTVVPQSQPNPQPVNNGRMHFFPASALAGRPLTLVGDVPDFGAVGFNDRTQSIRVESGNWEVCTDVGYRGGCRTLTPGDYPNLYNSMLDRSISSARMVAPPQQGVPVVIQDGVFPPGAPESPHLVMIFSDPDFRGDTYRASNDQPRLGDTTMDNRARSIFVREGRWEFCLDHRYRGGCVILEPGSYARMQEPFATGISSFHRVQ